MNRFSRIRHHVDMKDVKKRHLEESSAKKLEEKRIKEEIEQINSEYEKQKSDWRKEFKEDFTVISRGPTNSATQTFQHVSGQTFSFSGLGGKEVHPSTVNVFGDPVPAPDYNQLALAGYAKPLLMKRRDTEDVNPRLDASQEFAQKVGADVMMNARVTSDSESTKTSRTIKAAEIFAKYLTNSLPEGKWNDILGKDYLKYAIINGKLLSNGGVDVGDNVIGSAGSMTFDSQSGKYRFNFKGLGVEENLKQFEKGDYPIWKRAFLNALGKYSADLQPNTGLPKPLDAIDSLLGSLFSRVTTVAKLFGGGKDVDAFVEFSPEELFSKNPKLAQDYMKLNFGLTGPVWSPRMMGSPQGSNPSVTHNYYALYGKLPPRSVVKGSVPMNFGDHPEYDPAVIAKIDRMKKFLKSQSVKSSKTVQTVKKTTKTKSIGFDRDEPIVRRKKRNLTRV